MSRWRTIVLVVAVAAAGARARAEAPPFDAAAWRADYLQLRDHISSAYANLLARGIDLHALDVRTQARLAAARSDGEARWALAAFVGAFGDGHFRLLVDEEHPSYPFRLERDGAHVRLKRAPPGCALAVGDEVTALAGQPAVPFVSRYEELATAQSVDVRQAIALRLAVRGAFAPSPPYRITGTHGGKSMTCAIEPGPLPSAPVVTPSPTPTPARARCLAAGFWQQPLDATLSLAGRADYRPLPSGDNPFFAGTIQRTGLLRIAGFGEDMYLDVCERAAAGLPNDRDALYARVNARLTAALVERIEQFNARGVDRLVIDVTGNGGGSDWAAQVAPLFAQAPLHCPDVGMVRHAHWRQSIARSLADADHALPAAKTATERAALLHTRTLLAQAAEELAHDCDLRPLWSSSTARVSCSNLVRMAAPQCEWPTPKVVFRGRVVLLTDALSASATEQFVAMLKDYGGATVMGQRTFGVGCGYTDGGIPLTLGHSGLAVKAPDCARYRRNGSSEARGVAPDVTVDWLRSDTAQEHTAKALRALGLAP